ncbi:MAG: class I SAM-dependent methyltransferase [Acetatifactor sp.]|nr:class I SAM-dependent methyltransferase [Acetatifactor sp.]
MSSQEKALKKEEWAKHAQIGLAEKIVEDISNDRIPCWSRELLKLTSVGEKCLEIGCGTGQTSAYLATKGRILTALDYSEDSINLINELAKRMDIKIDTKCLDATKELPFNDNEFDTVFHCGLLEHFEQDERINLIRSWRRLANRMICMVPNAASLAYRVGKKMMEDNGTWEYGLEIPQFSLKNEFYLAGYNEIYEYTIGTQHALNFLPPRHYLRKAMSKLLKQKFNLDELGQGYLLVTIGEKK